LNSVAEMVRGGRGDFMTAQQKGPLEYGHFLDRIKSILHPVEPDAAT
jgi:hypothetical protein